MAKNCLKEYYGKPLRDIPIEVLKVGLKVNCDNGNNFNPDFPLMWIGYITYIGSPPDNRIKIKYGERLLGRCDLNHSQYFATHLIRGD